MSILADTGGLDFVSVPLPRRRAALAAVHQGHDRFNAEPNELAGETARRLEAYFRDPRTRFDDLPLAPRGTAFERQVWELLRLIPAGSTQSYGEIARALGRPGAARAVGRANALNPWAVVVPCHRVVGSNGALTGYGGGLDIKERLLAWERGASRFDGSMGAHASRH